MKSKNKYKTKNKHKTKLKQNKMDSNNKIFTVIIGDDGALEVRFERKIILEYYSKEENFINKINANETLDNYLNSICDILFDGDKFARKLSQELTSQNVERTSEEGDTHKDTISNDIDTQLKQMKQMMDISIERAHRPN